MKKSRLLTILCCIAMALAAIFGFAACEKENIESFYKPTNIIYDGERLTWDKVTLAEYYTVSINGGEEKRVNTTLFTWANSEDVEFDVTVNAVINGKSHGADKHFIPLDKIETFTVSNSGELTWDEIPGAQAYRISVNGNVLPTDSADNHYQPSEGTSRLRVRAVVPNDNSYYSRWSDEKQVHIYSAPTKINYDGETLRWSGNSREYEICVNGIPEQVTGNEYRFASDHQDFSVQVKALGDHSYSFDSPNAEETFHYLSPITQPIMEDGILHWESIDNAEGYELRINGVVQKETLKTNSYEKLSAGITHAVEIRPFNRSGKYFSVWSEIKNYYILEVPVTFWNADLELDGEANNNFVWNTVNGAVGYTVSVEKDGMITENSFPIAQTAFAYDYSEIGEYKVRVKAVADIGTDYSDSKYSPEFIIKRLPAPKANGTQFVTSDPNEISQGFTVHYNAVSGASGYQLYKDGVLLEGKYSNTLSITDSNVADDSITAQQEYNYIVRSMGSVNTAAGKTYITLPCLTKDALAFKITVMAMPTNLKMSGFTATWSAVSGNNGYAVHYSGNSVTASSTAFDLSTIKAGSYDVKVCTKGNGGSILPSNYTAPMTVERLIAPTDITISHGEGEGLLGFNSVTNAKSYQVFLDESDQALPESSFDNMYQYIRESGTVLHMVSVANYYNEQGTIYYMTSEASKTQQFIRLAAPTFPEGVFANSTELVWNAPSNINTQEYTPTYEVYEGTVMQTGGVQNATKFNIQYLDGGASYTFRVKAVGNNTKYLDSDKSVAVTVYKLATPKFEIKDGKYCWKGVANASGYVLEIDGVRVNNDIHISGSEYSYTPNYNEIGEHSVRLYAVGDGFNNINSDSVNYTQMVKACFAPEIKYAYTHEHFTNGGSIRVTITKASENCSKYQYEIAGESIVSSSLELEKVIESAGSYIIRVKALGGTFDSNDIYYIDSQFAGGGSGYQLLLLAPPTVSTFSLNSDGAAKWATITGANGYDYQISFDNGEFGDLQHTGTATLNDLIENYKNFSTIRIRVRACGNGTNSITSAWVEWIWSNPNK